ncbi:MAG: Rab family GTPase [Promethearchaeota archaeon]|jgi:Ras-related protein Rab-1A
MTEKIIKAIVYTSLDEKIGPAPLLWYPLDLTEKIRMGVSIKSITMLTTDQGHVPDKLVIMPFPSFNLKGIVKYIERAEDSYRGGVAISSITLLFDEADDIIFYKYMDYLEPVFSEVTKNIISLENKNVESIEIYAEINKLRKKLTGIFDDLRKKEKPLPEGDEFPEEGSEKESIRYHYKVVVCGDPSVGKTSTILRFTDNAFIRTYIPTLGVSVSEKKIKFEEEYVNFILWDIAGQSKFEVMRRHFYQGAEAIILIFDLTNRKSFESIPGWYNDIKKNFDAYQKKLIGFMLGNKEDLKNNRKISHDEATKVAENLNLEYVETSALTGRNVEISFYKLGETILNSKIKIN